MPSLKKVHGFPELTLHFQKLLKTQEYGAMQMKFRELFDQDITQEQVEQKREGIIRDKAMPLGKFVWSGDKSYIEYNVACLPHYRRDSHGKIYKDGRHESLPTLPQMGEVTENEIRLRAALTKKGLF